MNTLQQSRKEIYIATKVELELDFLMFPRMCKEYPISKAFKRFYWKSFGLGSILLNSIGFCYISKNGCVPTSYRVK